MHGVYPVTIVNTIIHADGIFTPTMSFDITIVDPCKTTVLNPVSLSGGITVINGETGSITFTEATDTVEQAKKIYTICGERSHRIVDPNDNDAEIDWLTIVDNEDGTYTVTAYPTDETNHQGTHAFDLWTTLDDYYPADHAGRRDTLAVVVSPTPCDCTGVLWTPPALVSHAFAVADGTYSRPIPPATINVPDSEALGPKIRACYVGGGPGCEETQTFVVTLSDGSALPSFLTQNVDVIEINPQVSADIGPWTLKIASTPLYGAPLDYNSLEFVISCTIQSIVTPSAPTGDLTYILYDATHIVDLSANVY